MASGFNVEVVDITGSREYESYLYRCLSPIPFRKYRKRKEYLERAVPQGFHKAILIFKGDVVGQIEYAPPPASGLPISGDDIIVMNCIWVFRRAKGHRFGRLLMDYMVESEGEAVGFSTIALEGHWSGWLRRWQMEWLGFKPIDSVKMRHRTKHRETCFEVYLMWLPRRGGVKPPRWDTERLLEGVNFCLAHLLYHPETLKGMREIYERC